MTIALPEVELKFPLYLEKPRLLQWVNAKLQQHRTGEPSKSPTYDALEKNPTWAQVGENIPLLELLQVLLELDAEVRTLRHKLADLSKPRSYLRMNRFAGRKRFAARLKEALPQRQKAYEAYEMLRKLTLSDPDGLMFKVVLT